MTSGFGRIGTLWHPALEEWVHYDIRLWKNWYTMTSGFGRMGTLWHPALEEWVHYDIRLWKNGFTMTSGFGRMGSLWHPALEEWVHYDILRWKNGFNMTFGFGRMGSLWHQALEEKWYVWKRQENVVTLTPHTRCPDIACTAPFVLTCKINFIWLLVSSCNHLLAHLTFGIIMLLLAGAFDFFYHAAISWRIWLLVSSCCY